MNLGTSWDIKSLKIEGNREKKRIGQLLMGLRLNWKERERILKGLSMEKK